MLLPLIAPKQTLRISIAPLSLPRLKQKSLVETAEENDAAGQADEDEDQSSSMFDEQ